jgi:glutamyl-Q tRNA(Asp) synthetase
MTTRSYTGRFAPSPTGPLHFGSLITAVASFCDARSQGGRWLVRIEDTDIPRIQAGAEASIREALLAFGLIADAPIVRQQDRLEQYEAALQQLAERDLVYACACTRKQLEGFSAYPNLCRDRQLAWAQQAIRLKVPDRLIEFEDRVQGKQTENLLHSTGDVVLKRRDGIISYQLAVVVDDAAQGVTDVVRGADLLDNTARQIWLGQCLGVPALRYAHLPLAMNASGQKLSKQNLAAALDLDDAPQLLRLALAALHQPDVGTGSIDVLLQRAVVNWSLERIPKQATLAGVYD